MKNRIVHFVVSALTILSVLSCENPANKYKEQSPLTNNGIEGKKIYIPDELNDMDFNDPESQWSYHRMACTENIAIFWEKGFGNDLSDAPELDGNSMNVDLENLKDRLEYFYKFFYEELQFAKTGSKCDKYRMMVMLNYSLEGTAYGGAYDNMIGALWVAPNRIQDKKLNCVAHELGHSFQSQIMCDGPGGAEDFRGFFEMTSQWMLWQVNPDWITDERFHWDAFKDLTYKAFLHLDNIYHSPYILEYWSEKRGLAVIADLFRNGKAKEDPVMTYKSMFNMSQEDFCDEMFDASCRIVNMDFKRAWNETRPYANVLTSKFDDAGDGWFRIADDNCPENYGFNAMQLKLPVDNNKVTVSFKGEAGTINPDKGGWRYGFVAVTSDGNTLYGDAGKDKSGSVSFVIPGNTELTHLWFVVSGAPTEHWVCPETGECAKWPYRIKVEGSGLLL